MKQIDARCLQKIFWLFVLLHLVTWTLLPTFARYNLPMDSIEGAVWAQKLVFGYDKAPLLNAWITALAIKLFGYVDWGIYLTSQIAVAICFIALWQLAKKMLPLSYALLSIMLLEGFQYYHIGAIDFNDNVLQLPLWALSVLFFYTALTENKMIHWVWFGIVAGLAMLAKYYAILLFVSMLLFLLKQENRKHWKESGIYLAGFVFLCMILPHILWLFQNDFLTFRYVFNRVGDLPSWKNHFVNPLLFLRDEAYALVVPGLLFASLSFGDSTKKEASSGVFLMPNLNSFQKKFLIYLAFGPFILEMTLSFFTGIKLHIMWGSALFSLWGIWVMGFFPPKLNSSKMIGFFATLLLLLVLAQIGYALSLYQSKNTSSAHFSGKEIANELTREWHVRYQKSLTYIVGSRWLAGNIMFYSSDHPVALVDNSISAYAKSDVNLMNLDQKGVLSVSEVEKYSGIFLQEYQSSIGIYFEYLVVKTFPWQFAEGVGLSNSSIVGPFFDVAVVMSVENTPRWLELDNSVEEADTLRINVSFFPPI